MRSITGLALAGMCAVGLACGKPTTANTSSPAPTAADARTFLDDANADDVEARHPGGQAGWVQQTFITDDTEAIAARANQAANEAGAQVRQGRDAVRPRRCAGRRAAAAESAEGVAGPRDAVAIRKESDELSKIMARLESTYGKGKWCPDPAKPDTCKNIDDVTRIMATVRRREDAARGVGRAGTRSRRRCARTTSGSSSCRTRARRSSASPTPARCGASKYDMPPDEFTQGARSAVGSGAAALPEAARLRAH